MTRLRILLPALLLAPLLFGQLSLPGPALAHKVSLFAYVEAGQVVLDAFYSKSNKVRAGRIVVSDAATGEKLLEAVTDDDGALRFPVPEAALSARRDLRLTLMAGEGHQAETLVRASEYGPAPKAPAPAAPQATPDKAAPAQAARAKAVPVQAGQAQAATDPALNPALEQLIERAVERAVDRAVDGAVERRMAPVRQLVQQQAEKGPGMVEIVGGIGYILGLFGVAAFFAAKRRERQHK